MVKKSYRKPDRYSLLAKQQGFRSRAAYKLIQLNRKYDFLGKSKVVLDLCAAPGGWMQVAAKYCPVDSIILGVDLVSIKPVAKTKAFQEDITTEKCRTTLRRELHGWKADLVLHDGAPNMGMAWTHDAFSQSELVLKALHLATDFLREGGTFVSKVFRSNDYNALMYVMQKFFRKVEATKPKSSRSTSAEIFVVCQGYLNPRIDPKLLDPKFVFKEVVEQNKKTDIFHRKETVNRGGYDDGISLVFKSVPASEFVASEDEIGLLGSVNEFTFDDAESKEYLDHRLTTDEVRACCADLRVLGKGDLKSLLKWRRAMREAFGLDKEEVGDAAPAGAAEEAAPKTMEDMDAELEQQLADDAVKLARRDRRRMKKETERMRRERERREMGLSGGDGFVEEDKDMFSLRTLRTDEDLAEMERLGADPYAGVDESSDDDDELVDMGIDDVEKLLATGQAEDMDEAYDMWLEANLNRIHQAVHSRRRSAGFDPSLVTSVGEEGAEDSELAASIPAVARAELAQTSLVKRVQAESNAAQPDAWFDQDLFADVLEDEREMLRVQQKKLEEASSSEDADEAAGGDQARKRRRRGRRGADRGGDGEEEVEFEEVPIQAIGGSSEDDDVDAEDDEDADAREAVRKARYAAMGAGAAGMESDSEESSELEAEDNVEEVARTLAIAKKMNASARDRREILEGSYGRYARTEGTDDLPVWFRDYEAKHMRPNAPITKADVEAMKARFRALDARPIKKVAEARARKRKRSAEAVSRAREKAEAIARSQDLSEKAKLKQIKQLYKAAGPKKVAPVKVVTNSFKAGTRKPRKSGRIKYVDPRMKKDQRGQETAERKNHRKRGGRSLSSKRKRR